MKLKIVFVILTGFLILFFAPNVYAANVQTIGRIVDSQGIPVSESEITFKDSTTQRIIATTKADFNGLYSVSIPQGTYIISITYPSKTGLPEKTEVSKTITSNIVNTITFPSSPGSASQKTQNSLGSVVLYLAMAIVIILILGIGYIVWKRR